MSNASFLEGRSLLVVVVREDAEGRREAALIEGVARWREGRLFVERPHDAAPVELPGHLHERILPAADETLSLFAEYLRGRPEFLLMLQERPDAG